MERMKKDDLQASEQDGEERTAGANINTRNSAASINKGPTSRKNRIRSVRPDSLSVIDSADSDWNDESDDDDAGDDADDAGDGDDDDNEDADDSGDGEHGVVNSREDGDVDGDCDDNQDAMDTSNSEAVAGASDMSATVPPATIADVHATADEDGEKHEVKQQGEDKEEEEEQEHEEASLIGGGGRLYDYNNGYPDEGTGSDSGSNRFDHNNPADIEGVEGIDICPPQL